MKRERPGGKPRLTVIDCGADYQLHCNELVRLFSHGVGDQFKVAMTAFKRRGELSLVWSTRTIEPTTEHRGSSKLAQQKRSDRD